MPALTTELSAHALHLVQGLLGHHAVQLVGHWVSAPFCWDSTQCSRLASFTRRAATSASSCRSRGCTLRSNSTHAALPAPQLTNLLLGKGGDPCRTRTHARRRLELPALPTELRGHSPLWRPYAACLTSSAASASRSRRRASAAASLAL